VTQEGGNLHARLCRLLASRRKALAALPLDTPDFLSKLLNLLD
jgi:hypothetical protein